MNNLEPWAKNCRFCGQHFVTLKPKHRAYCSENCYIQQCLKGFLTSPRNIVPKNYIYWSDSKPRGKYKHG